ncbi:MAG: LPS export ABC transporter permease LptF [Gammaproteobacteria bacterium]|nr:LPS export ABC transporter permease LptF [Gammaproteobacteria bacterium]
MPLTIIDRYLIKEILQAWFAVTLVLLLILVSNSLVLILSKAVDGSLPNDAVLPLFFTYVISFLVTLIPLGLYLGVMLSLGRLYKDSEMSALNACGIGSRQLFRPVLACAGLAVLIIVCLTLWASPWAARVEQQLKANLEQRSELNNVNAGRFNVSRDGKSVLFVKQVSADGTVLEDVFVHAKTADGRLSLEVAEQATFVRGDKNQHAHVLFERGRRYVGQPGQADYEVTEFERHGIVVMDNPVVQQALKRAAKTTTELWSSDLLADRAELQWRLNLPLVALILALLAVPLSRTTPRKGRYGKLVVAVLFYVPYSNFLVLSKNWMIEGVTAPYLGMWWLQLLMLSLVLLLILNMHGFAWAKQILLRRGA